MSRLRRSPFCAFAARVAAAAAVLGASTLPPITGQDAGAEKAAAKAANDDPVNAERPDRETLLRRVREAHAPRSAMGEVLPPPRADRFRAQLVVGRVGSAAAGGGGEDRNIDIELQAEYLRSTDPRVGSMIHYVVEEQGRRLERGRDGDGVWTAKDGEVFDVSRASAREYATEREAVLQNIRLADQLLRFLDPATEIGRLTDVTAPRLQDPPLRSLRGSRWWTIEGLSPSFPTYHAKGERRPAWLRLWIDAERFELRFIEARPVELAAERTGRDDEPNEAGGEDWGFDGDGVDGAKTSQNAPADADRAIASPSSTPKRTGSGMGAYRILPGGEAILLDDLQRADGGPLVPTVLRIRRLSPSGRPEAGGAVQVRIRTLALDPSDLTSASIARPNR
jgi:hypothetical protein